MQKYVIAIEETVVEEFEIEANNACEALEVAEESYRNGEIVLTSGEVQFKQISIVRPQNEASEWIKF